MENVRDEDVADEDVKTASTIIIVSAVQLIGILLLIALLCLAKRFKAMPRFKLEERDKPPAYQPPPSFNAAMKMSQEVSWNSAIWLLPTGQGVLFLYNDVFCGNKCRYIYPICVSFPQTAILGRGLVKDQTVCFFFFAPFRRGESDKPTLCSFTPMYTNATPREHSRVLFQNLCTRTSELEAQF